MKRTELTKAGLDRLLKALGPDREKGGEEYVRLQRKMSTIHAARTVRADEAADEALDRTASRLKEESVGNPGGFAYGTSFNVVRELLRAPEAKSTPFNDATLPLETVKADNVDEPQDPDSQHDCMKTCLGQLADDDRAFLWEYLAVAPPASVTDKPKHRRMKLVEHLGTTSDAARKRAQRLKAKVRACISDCVKEHRRESDTKPQITHSE